MAKNETPPLTNEAKEALEKVMGPQAVAEVVDSAAVPVAPKGPEDSTVSSPSVPSATLPPGVKKETKMPSGNVVRDF